MMFFSLQHHLHKHEYKIRLNKIHEQKRRTQRSIKTCAYNEAAQDINI